jgi:hypothetical protein
VPGVIEVHKRSKEIFTNRNGLVGRNVKRALLDRVRNEEIGDKVEIRRTIKDQTDER